MDQCKLKFVVGGTQKGGTSTLDSILRLHPQIQMASVKETHFFDDETLDWTDADYRILDSFYPPTDDRIRGEATPITMYWRPAVSRLHSYNPDIKIILLLRNPIERAFSNWRKEYSINRDTALFADAIREGRQRVTDQTAPPGLHRVFSYVERGLYGEQLDYLLRYFPKHNIRCEISEEFFQDRRPILTHIANFLGINDFPEDIPFLHVNPGRAFPYPSSLTRDDVAYLKGIFRRDIEAVESFLNRNIAVWHDANT